jgi:acyl carrier protein
MTTTDVRTQVRQFVTTNFYLVDPDALADSTSLVASGIIDSTGVLELATFVENEYAISVPDDDMIPANFDSIDALVGFVLRKRG